MNIMLDPFEDGFIHINKNLIKENSSLICGMKNINKLMEKNISSFDLTDKIIDSKSKFASSILYSALSADTQNSIEWQTPKYIIDGLQWLSK